MFTNLGTELQPGPAAGLTVIPPYRSLNNALRQLRGLRFKRFAECETTVRDLHRLKGRIDANPVAAEIWQVHDWLISPLTLQALDFVGIAKHIVTTLRERKEFDADFIFLLRLIHEPPDQKTRDRMRRLEEAVAEGRYDGLSKEPNRYKELEDRVRGDPELFKFWNRLRSRYGRQFRPNPRGVIRRTLARERGFDSRHGFRWNRKQDRYRVTFDALCHRWFLYGYEKEIPLALKLTANPTPHGTMIFVPRGISLAVHGTFVWKAITEIHRAYGAPRQGNTYFEIRKRRIEDRKRAKIFDAEALKLGLHGKKRFAYDLEKLGQLPNRVRWLKRLLYGS